MKTWAVLYYIAHLWVLSSKIDIIIVIKYSRFPHGIKFAISARICEHADLKKWCYRLDFSKTILVLLWLRVQALQVGLRKVMNLELLESFSGFQHPSNPQGGGGLRAMMKVSSFPISKCWQGTPSCCQYTFFTAWPKLGTSLLHTNLKCVAWHDYRDVSWRWNWVQILTSGLKNRMEIPKIGLKMTNGFIGYPTPPPMLLREILPLVPCLWHCQLYGTHSIKRGLVSLTKTSSDSSCHIQFWELTQSGQPDPTKGECPWYVN